MKLLADLHISPRTVAYLRTLGHDVIRVTDELAATASDVEIISQALQDGRVVLTQDLDFSRLIALSGKNGPSLITLRLSSSRVEFVNQRLKATLPPLGPEVAIGAMITIEDKLVRRRQFPNE